MPVIIGMDPHKRSATIEVIDTDAKILAVGRYSTDTSVYSEMLTAVQRFPERVWAIEGCNGIGRHLRTDICGGMHSDAGVSALAVVPPSEGIHELPCLGEWSESLREFWHVFQSS